MGRGRRLTGQAGALIVTGSSPAPVCCGIWYQGERHPPPLPFGSGPSRILTGIGMLLLNAPRRRQRAPRSHEALLMRARRNAGMTEQRLARAPQKARVARRTSRLRVGSQGGTPTHTSSIIRPSASTTARQTAAQQHTVKRRRPASAPPLPRIIPGRRAGAAPPRPGASGSAGPVPGRA